MTRLTLTIDGMHCGRCVAHVREALDELPGVRAEAVRVGEATVAYDAGAATPALIAAALAGAGYPAQPAGAPGA